MHSDLVVPGNVHGRIAVAEIPLILLSLMPVAMFFANKSSSLVIVLAAAVTLLVTSREAAGMRRLIQPKEWRRSKRLRIAGPAAGLAVLSAVVSPDNIRSLDILAGTMIVGAACYVCVSETPRDETGAFRRFAFVTLIAFSMAVIAEEAFGMPFHKMLGLRSEAFALKRPVICGVLLFLSLLTFALRTYRWHIVACGALLQIGAIAAAHSGAAAFGVIGFLAGILGCRLVGARFAKGALLAWVSGCLIVAPVIGTGLAPFKDGVVVGHLRAFHLKERIEIWNAFDIAVRERPILGYGFGASQEVVEAIARERGFDRTMDVARDIHPHNGYLQIWVEMGMVGAIAAFIALALVILRLDERAAAFDLRFGIWTFCCVLMLLSHSLWQTWWIASIGAAATWLTIEDSPRAGRDAGPWARVAPWHDGTVEG